MRFTAETREVFEMQNVTSAYMKGRTITSQPSFFIHGAPRARAPLILATEYASYASQRARNLHLALKNWAQSCYVTG